MDRNIRSSKRRGKLSTRLISTASGYGEIVRVQQPFAGFAHRRECADFGVVGNVQLLARCFDDATVAAVRPAFGLDRAAKISLVR